MRATVKIYGLEFKAPNNVSNPHSNPEVKSNLFDLLGSIKKNVCRMILPCWPSKKSESIATPNREEPKELTSTIERRDLLPTDDGNFVVVKLVPFTLVRIFRFRRSIERSNRSPLSPTDVMS